MGSHQKALQVVRAEGLLVIVEQEGYHYVRIVVRTDNLVEAIDLERLFGGSRSYQGSQYVWYAQAVETISAVINGLRRRSETRRSRDIFNLIQAYCTAPRGAPRTYAAKTLQAHLGGESVKLSDL
jgi:hypothetical protein